LRQNRPTNQPSDDQSTLYTTQPLILLVWGIMIKADEYNMKP